MGEIIGKENDYYYVEQGRETWLDHETSLSENVRLAEQIGVENIANGFHCYCFTQPAHLSDPAYYCLDKKGKVLQLTWVYSFDSLEWDWPVALNALMKEVASRSATQNISCKEDNDQGYADLEFTYLLEHGRAADVWPALIQHSSQLIEASLEHLLTVAAPQAFKRVFHFPEPYRALCCQYLIWFGEVLSASGIAASVNADNRQDGATLFSVLPQQQAALTKEIETLFIRYLQLPCADSLVLNHDALSPPQRAMRQALVAQVEHFKTQLELKNAIIELKNATIGTLEQQLETLRDGSVVLASMENRDDIELIQGAVKIGDFKWFGLSVSPGKLIKAVRRFTRQS